MAGICGILGHPKSQGTVPSAHLRAMLDAIVHRGPGDEGAWASPKRDVQLGHRRVAVRVQDDEAAEPISDVSETVWVCLDGGLANAAELREELRGRGRSLRTSADAEIIAQAYQEWGDGFIGRLVGSFAFAVYDTKRRRLLCARDRMGAKSLYYALAGGDFYFASEAKAILATGAVEAELDPHALTEYLVLQGMLGERTLFSGVRQIPSGHYLTLENGAAPRVSRYWDLHFQVDFSHDEPYFRDQLLDVIERAVRLHVDPRIEWGAFLSGGIDSSTIACLAAQRLAEAGRSLTLLSGAYTEGEAFDESRYQKLVADQIGGAWLRLHPTADEFVADMPRIIYFMDTPSGGPGVFGQFRMGQFASEHVKAVLSGEGGDEAFLGYARYLICYLEECLLGAIDETADKGEFAATLATIIPSLPMLKTYKPMLQYFWQEDLFDSPARRYFRLMDRSAGLEQIYQPDALAGRPQVYEEFESIFEGSDARSIINKMQYFDVRVNLPVLLQVDDRTTAAWGLEGCAPLLDHRLVELMATIPPVIKFRGGQAKYLFRQAVRGLVPDAIVARKDKMGFPLPLDQWIRGPAREFVRDILLSESCRQRGIFLPGVLEKLLESERPFGRALWGALCLELWARCFLDGERAV